jgi:hypothetical protein
MILAQRKNLAAALATHDPTRIPNICTVTHIPYNQHHKRTAPRLVRCRFRMCQKICLTGRKALKQSLLWIPWKVYVFDDVLVKVVT